MVAWKEIVGLRVFAADFPKYRAGLQWRNWRPSFVVLHNTGVPNLEQRPEGFSKKDIDGLVSYYRDEKKWSAGPHLFIDDHGMWVFTPLTTSGVHSPSWNTQSLGFEMLGDYDKDDFQAGRGGIIRNNAVIALATICEVLGLDAHTIRLHREDPLTTHACPGSHVRKLEVIQAVSDYLVARHAGEHPHKPAP